MREVALGPRRAGEGANFFAIYHFIFFTLNLVHVLSIQKILLCISIIIGLMFV